LEGYRGGEVPYPKEGEVVQGRKNGGGEMVKTKGGQIVPKVEMVKKERGGTRLCTLLSRYGFLIKGGKRLFKGPAKRKGGYDMELRGLKGLVGREGRKLIT